MTKEYITKNRAKQFVCGHCNEVCSEEPCEPSDCDWMAFIDKEPAADVAPAVELEDLRAKYQALVAEKDKNSGDTAETYTTGYRYGHRNGQIELLQQILGICDGVSEPEETNE